MSESQLARACGVDPKTVSRWLSNPARPPHPRHRAAVSRALGEEESVIWPAVQQLVKSGADREMVQLYPYRGLHQLLPMAGAREPRRPAAKEGCGRMSGPIRAR
ncbi:hypothetical protein [Kitasatospora nipponensis]